MAARGASSGTVNRSLVMESWQMLEPSGSCVAAPCAAGCTLSFPCVISREASPLILKTPYASVMSSSSTGGKVSTKTLQDTK